MKIFAETERLILREILLTDLEGMYELDSDPEVHRYLGNKPVVSKGQIIEVIKSVRQQYADFGIGRWAIVKKNTNMFVGWAGLKYVTVSTNNHMDYYDIGYRIIKKYWRQGIASESAFAVKEYAFSKMNLNEIYAAASCENEGSNKILKKIGMKFVETFYYGDIKCNWYRIGRAEYEKNGL
jgi:[ribosomal protein S5]-alanine N-acetyltransferase